MVVCCGCRTGGDGDKAGQNQDAIRALRQAVETNPRSVRAQLTLAIHTLATAVRFVARFVASIASLGDVICTYKPLHVDSCAFETAV